MTKRKAPEDDAWKQHYDLLEKFSTRVKVREDIIVEALGTERGVRLTVKRDNPHARSPLGPDRWISQDTGRRNVSTMRELAKALNDACDFVEASNPQWTAKGEHWRSRLRELDTP